MTMTGDWDSIKLLWERATGGGDVAADPAAWRPSWPPAPPAPAVAEFLSWLSDGLLGVTQRMVFLVGGPGAGKSHAAAGLVRELDLVSRPSDGLASRRYLFETKHSGLAVGSNAPPAT